MTHLEQVRAAIIAAVPEIVELKKGCQISWHGIIGQMVAFHHFDPASADSAFDILATFDGSQGIRRCDPSEHGYEILGRPIRLADVLVAIRKKKSNFYDEDDEVAMEFAHRDLQETVMELLGLYDLLKDDISLQSSPCIHFLHTLLAEK